MSLMGEEREQTLKTRVAWLYHMEGMTQEAIAEKLEISRARVLKLLAQCRQDGTVQIRVTSRLASCVALERRLEQRFGISQVAVIPTPNDEEALPNLIGATAGAYLSDALRDGMTVGLGWGRTLQASINAIAPRPLRGLTVVSLLGALTRASGLNPSEFAWRFADLFGAESYLLSAPVFAPTEQIKKALFQHGGIEETLIRARHLDLAIVGAGDFSPAATILRYGLLSKSEIDDLQQQGAVGDVLCHFYDRKGELLDHPVNSRVMAVHPMELRRAPKLVLASGGWRKVTSILAAIRLLRPTVLITDEGAAEGLLARAEEMPDLVMGAA
jgi:DNA-binding transcriptional regulator LsrR (DeoR family)